MRRTAHSGYPLRVDYALTASGLRLVPLIDAIGDWWDDRLDEPDDNWLFRRCFGRWVAARLLNAQREFDGAFITGRIPVTAQGDVSDLKPCC